jgi:hypothetical protein
MFDVPDRVAKKTMSPDWILALTGPEEVVEVAAVVVAG